MSGIVFLKSQQLPVLREFYLDRIGCHLWLDQDDCLIFRHGNFLFGFCKRDAVDTTGMLTFFYESQAHVDRMHAALRPVATTVPELNPKYNIYQFFARDPEGRVLEFQYFADRVTQYRTGEDLLLTRRSVRDFAPDEVSDDTVNKIIDLSRFAPTARNSQSYYFKIVRDREVRSWLSGVRGSSSRPLGESPLAVAICADPAISKRYEQDACIAAYHFMLAAWFHGLGTCWIGGMNDNEVKKRLHIPPGHYVATVTPLGYPKERLISPPERKTLKEFRPD